MEIASFEMSLKTQNERIPNRKATDNRLYDDYSSYFDLYENPNWRETPWYKQFFNRFFYFITGPKFVVPFLGCVIKRSRQNVISSPMMTSQDRYK